MSDDRIHGSTRREFIRNAGLGALAVAAGGLSRPGLARAAPQIALVGWTFRPDMVQTYIDMFNEKYGEDVDYSTLPWPTFHPTLEQRFFAGEIVDVMYCTHNNRQRWFERGMIRNIEDLEGFDEIRSAMLPAALASLTSKDGEHVIALPYYSAYFIMMYNDPMLKQAGFEKPGSTWDEIIEQCVKLKKDGISEYPMLPNWNPTQTGTNPQFLSDCFAEGATLFDDANKLQADQDEVAHVMERWQKMYELGLVTPEIFTQASSTDTHRMMFTGKYAFHSNHCNYLQDTATDEKQSQLAGKKARITPYPGKTGDTYAWTDSYVLNAKTEALDDAWKLMRFLGANLNGDWHVQKQWAVSSGVQNPYPAFYEDPEVIASTDTWVDPEILKQQAGKGKVINAFKESWYPEYDTKVVPIMHDMIRKKSTVPETIEAMTQLYTSVAS